MSVARVARPRFAAGPATQTLDASPATADSAVMDLQPRHLGAFRIAGVATALGVFSGLQAYNYVSLFTDRKQPFLTLLALNLTYWYAWAVLVPGMVWMARRYRFERQRWPRSMAMHLLVVPVFIFAHAVLATSSRVAVLTVLAARETEWWPAFRELFFLNFDWEMMTYWAVIGLSQAIDYRHESQERELTAAQLETRLAEAQLQALQRQLHPHFLFNTLHTISALIHRDPQSADDMLARLSDLLRLTLDRLGTQQVTLEEELDFLRKYLEIEQTRFGDRLQVHMDIEAGTLDAALPNLLLQPLVENALRHGIGPKIGGGRVDVRACREGDQLRLVVTDDGHGVSADKLNAFNTGVGLRNTRSRLEHLYGGRHRFEFRTVSGGGLEVTIVIPFTVAITPNLPADMEGVA
jgi:signal transduction histidine kinase